MSEMKKPERGHLLTPDNDDKPRMSLLVIVLAVLFGLCLISAVFTLITHLG
jgi:hypothetical protein